jgi:hypothetical protein
MLVEQIFQYRTLIGKCELGCGLDWDEIEQVTVMEHAFKADRGKSGRKFKREKVAMTGLVRGDRINDRVDIVEIGPGGLVCRQAPFVARGELVELVLDVGDRSYRFRAKGVWLKDDGDDYRVGLVFVGVPICLNQLQVRAHEADLVDHIAVPAAAA